MELIITLVIAGIVGWIASMIMKTDNQMGIVGNVVAGLVGGFLGNLLFGWLSPAAPFGRLGVVNIIVGVIGACIAIFLYQVINGQRRV